MNAAIANEICHPALTNTLSILFFQLAQIIFINTKWVYIHHEWTFPHCKNMVTLQKYGSVQHLTPIQMTWSKLNWSQVFKSNFKTLKPFFLRNLDISSLPFPPSTYFFSLSYWRTHAQKLSLFIAPEVWFMEWRGLLFYEHKNGRDYCTYKGKITYTLQEKEEKL